MPPKRSLEWTDQPRRPEPPEELTGKILANHFRLDACVTVTRTSSLYRGHDLHGRADVAVKILRSELDAGWEERFRREGQILARLRHPNIADFIDCGVTEDGLCYLVTALVEGRSLASACDESAPLTLEEVWQVGLQIADALSCAHDRGVIHRDVKPSNILLTSAGVAKLIDFGIAKLQPGAQLEVTPVRHPTAVGVPIGTPGYIPPEAGEQIDARTDVFGLGRTLYRLITRKSADDAPAGLNDTPEPLRQVVMQAMHTDPERRIASVAAFRRRWFEAGVRVWPRSRPVDVELHPAPRVWPSPPDQSPAPTLIGQCAGAEAREPCTSTVPPRLFERRLELRTRLGDGRCGQTWRAYHHLLGRQVAVKIVPRTFAGPDIVAGLCREAMALDKLTHRAFPRVLECDYATDGSWYMVEEYIDGELLSETFKRAPIDPLTAVDIVTEIAEALCEAHACGILHGDIKGNNLILERALPPRPRVIDLSECRLQEGFFAATDQRYAPSPLHRMDSPGNRCHPDFAAPELSRGGRKSAASDVYALGVVLFILLTGRRNGAKALRDLFEVGERDEADERLRDLLVSSAPELEATFIAANLADVLAPEPERRTATMAEFLELLRVEGQALRDLRTPAAARPPSPPALASRPAQVRAPTPGPTPRAPAWWSWAIAAAAATLGAALWLSFQPARPPAPTPATPVPSDPPRGPPASPTSPQDAGLHVKSTAPATQALPRERVQAALAARISELARCPDAPPRLTLALDVGRRVELAEVQHVEVDPMLPLDLCVRAIVEAIALPPSDTPTRHVVTLEIGDAARR